MSNSEIAYHSNRASTELHLGLTTASAAAARAHLKLSALHLQKARGLQLRARDKKALGRRSRAKPGPEAKADS